MGIIKLPKVLVFTITYSGKDYVYDKWKKAAKAINYPNFDHVVIDNTRDNGEYSEKLSKDFWTIHVERGNSSREGMARSQEKARLIAVEKGYDYILSLESDIIPTPDIIQELIKDAKEYVGALYFIGDDNQRLPCITLPEKHEKTGLIGSRLIKPEEIKDYYKRGLRSVNNCGLGCTLIKRRVFEKIKFNYYPNLRNHSDSFYANDAWRNGFRVFVDTDIILEHHNVPWTNVKDR
jgi:GT2 family glycosyltransferase